MKNGNASFRKKLTKMKKVEVYLYQTSTAIVFENVENTYQKGDLFCIYASGKVHKFPLIHIFRIIEDY
jgi:hypothetical protein